MYSRLNMMKMYRFTSYRATSDFRNTCKVVKLFSKHIKVCNIMQFPVYMQLQCMGFNFSLNLI